MIITLLISIFSTRIILNALGFVDNGLYNLVGGFVALFGIVTSSMSSAISRFITYEIGSGNNIALNSIFKSALKIQKFLGIAIILLGETIGLWVLFNVLNIPKDRFNAVFYVYQFSLIGFALGLMMIAQNSLLVAYERFDVIAKVSILSSLAKLAIVIAVYYSSMDRLILYSGLLFVLSLVTRLFYIIYIKRHFPNINPKLAEANDNSKKLYSFACWNLFGEVSGVLKGSGIGIVLNLFGGPIANTKNGIANQINGLVSIFVNDFTSSYRPQITKLYAQGESDLLKIFLYRCSKFSFYLVSILAVPVLFNMHELLIIWLKSIPDGTCIFATIVIICSLCESVSYPLITAKHATGNVKYYQIVVGGILLFTVPLAYIFLKIGLPIYFAYVAILITSLSALATRLYMLRGFMKGWSTFDYVKTVLLRLIAVFLVAISLPIVLKIYIVQTGIMQTLIISGVDFIWSGLVILIVGCDKSERSFIVSNLKRLLGKLFRLNEK
jgi:O-antigen/teichoic acid export membrane protein